MGTYKYTNTHIRMDGKGGRRERKREMDLLVTTFFFLLTFILAFSTSDGVFFPVGFGLGLGDWELLPPTMCIDAPSRSLLFSFRFTFSFLFFLFYTFTYLSLYIEPVLWSLLLPSVVGKNRAGIV